MALRITASVSLACNPARVNRTTTGVRSVIRPAASVARSHSLLRAHTTLQLPLRDSVSSHTTQFKRQSTICSAEADGTGSTSTEDRYNLGEKSTQSGLTIPTMLTLLRIAVIPVLVGLYYVEASWTCTACASIFVVAALTDWLDGYLARKMNSTSAFGAFLDPVADKLMVTAALILLCAKVPAGLCTTYPWMMPAAAIVIIAREITMSALREWAAAAGGDAHKAVAVSSIGKWKTASQMAALTLLLLLRDADVTVGLAAVGSQAGVVLLAIATFLTLWSLASYMSGALKYMLN